MSVFYNGEHQICFWRKVFKKTIFIYDDERYTIENPKFSWDDFHLIPLTRPFIAESKPNYSVVQIPNSSKRLNITNNMAGGLTYESRTGEWEFAIDHDQWGDWVVSHHTLEEYFNGSKMLVALNDDPTKIYEGRIILKDYEAEKSYSKIKMAYDLDSGQLASTDLANVMFRVQFLDKRNNVLQKNLLSYGSAPYYSGAIPYEYGMVFDRWFPSLIGVNGNVDYIPIYKR